MGTFSDALGLQRRERIRFVDILALLILCQHQGSVANLVLSPDSTFLRHGYFDSEGTGEPLDFQSARRLVLDSADVLGQE
jgi:hypothetical protein